MKQLLIVFFTIICFKSLAQDTLPRFSAVILNNTKAQISWTNTYPNCTQISVQRSYDSLRFFQTIFSALSPELPQNGYADNNYISQIKIYYRIFYVLEDGSYFFTTSKTASKFGANKIGEKITDTDKQKDENNNNPIVIDTANYSSINLINSPNPAPLPIKRMFSVYKRSTDSLYNVLEEKFYHKFKDSIAHKTKDTLYALDNDIIIWKPFVPKPLWKPSLQIFTANKGYVVINLPLTKTHKYRIIFFDENDQEIFRIKQLKQEKLMLEKSNFLHAGWFHFELYEDEKLKEKNLFLVEKDF